MIWLICMNKMQGPCAIFYHEWTLCKASKWLVLRKATPMLILVLLPSYYSWKPGKQCRHAFWELINFFCVCKDIAFPGNNSWNHQKYSCLLSPNIVWKSLQKYVDLCFYGTQCGRMKNLFSPKEYFVKSTIKVICSG